MAPLALSRSDLLHWINSSFDPCLNYTKIEQCGKGVAFCLIFDKLYPQTINLNRLNKAPQNEYQTLQNYKLLQHGFSKRGITRDVNVERLMKCRLQDNLEFLQWFASQWVEMVADIPSSSSEKVTSTSRRSSMRPSRPSTSGQNSPRITSHNDRRVSSNGSGSSNTATKSTIQPITKHANTAMETLVGSLKQEVAKLKNDQIKLETELAALSETSEQLNTERNFYLEKLRDIEALSLDIQEGALDISRDHFVESVLQILYSTKEGFEVVNEDEIVAQEFDINGNNNNNNNSNNNENNDNTLMETPKSESLMGIIPDEHVSQSHNSNILDDDETF